MIGEKALFEFSDFSKEFNNPLIKVSRINFNRNTNDVSLGFRY